MHQHTYTGKYFHVLQQWVAPVLLTVLHVYVEALFAFCQYCQYSQPVYLPTGFL
jgi:hypothetical protein